MISLTRLCELIGGEFRLSTLCIKRRRHAAAVKYKGSDAAFYEFRSVSTGLRFAARNDSKLIVSQAIAKEIKPEIKNTDMPGLIL